MNNKKRKEKELVALKDKLEKIQVMIESKIVYNDKWDSKRMKLEYKDLLTGFQGLVNGMLENIDKELRI